LSIFDPIFKENVSSDTFTFSNTALVGTITVGLLASDWVSIAFPLIQRVDTTIVLDPATFSDYETLVRDKEANKKRIKHIRIITDNLNQLSNGLGWQKRNANGEVELITDFPINQLSPMQFQSRVLDIDYTGMTMGLDEFIRYEILPSTDVLMTFEYEDFRIEKLLNKKPKNRLLTEFKKLYSR